MRTKASFPHQIVGFYVSGRRAAHPPPADEADIFVLVLVSVSASAISHSSRIGAALKFRVTDESWPTGSIVLIRILNDRIAP
jgi:hypothetical protein